MEHKIRVAFYIPIEKVSVNVQFVPSLSSHMFWRRHVHTGFAATI